MSEHYKRTKQIIIRTTMEEYNLLQKICTRPRLAMWMRETCLGVKQPKPSLKVDPALLLSLAKIGGNLNQIAKHINQHNNCENLINHFRIINELSLIRNDLDSLLTWHIDMEHLYASEDI